MLSYISLAAYVLSFIFCIVYFFYDKKYSKILCNIFVLIGFLMGICQISYLWKYTGIISTTSVYDFMVLLSTAFAITYFIVNIRLKSISVGLFILPFPVIFSIIAAFSSSNHETNLKAVQSAWRYVHLPFIILGTTFFIASFLSAIMFLIQEKQLRKKKFGVIYQRFPSLDILNGMNNMTLKLGFFFFTIGAVLGFIWMAQSGLEHIIISAKIIFSIVTWIIFAFIIINKARKRMSPKTTALWTIVGFLCVLVTYIGVAVFLTR